jgi:lysophospholipid acyltransferase (LPLAT)-like uncharacterized protein
MKDARGASELPIRIRAGVVAGGTVIRALAATWRYRILEEHRVTALRASKTPIVFTLWHGQMLPLLWHHRDQGVAVLVSEHKDGEVIARILQLMGYRLIRGSTSRGAGRALIGLVRTLKEGNDVAVTPDGPRGPRHQFAPGAAVAANRAGAPVVPAVAFVDRYWQLRTWDGFIIPKPFARITIAYGPPTRVEGDTPREAGEAAARLQQLMEEAYAQAAG